MFIGLLASAVKASSHTKYESLNNQQCMTQTTLINFYPKEYTQGLCYDPFAVN